jgi:hypothetical protein
VEEMRVRVIQAVFISHGSQQVILINTSMDTVVDMNKPSHEMASCLKGIASINAGRKSPSEASVKRDNVSGKNAATCMEL